MSLGQHEDGSRQRTTCSVLLALSGGLATAALAAIVLSGDQVPAAAPGGPSGTAVRPPVDSSDGSGAGSLGVLGTEDSPAFTDLTQYGAGEGWRAVPCIGLPGFTWGELDVLMRTVHTDAPTPDLVGPDTGPASPGARAASLVGPDGATSTSPVTSARGTPRAVADIPGPGGSRPPADGGVPAPRRDAEPSPGPEPDGADPAPRPTTPVEGVTAPVQRPVERATEPVRRPVEQVTEPVRRPVEQVTDVVRKPVEQVTQPVPKPVEQVTDVVRKPVEQVTQTVQEPVDRVVPQAPAVVAPTPESVVDAVQGSGPLGVG